MKIKSGGESALDKFMKTLEYESSLDRLMKFSKDLLDVIEGMEEEREIKEDDPALESLKKTIYEILKKEDDDEMDKN